MEVEQDSGGILLSQEFPFICWTENRSEESQEKGIRRQLGKQREWLVRPRAIFIIQEVLQHYNHQYWPKSIMAEYQPFHKPDNVLNREFVVLMLPHDTVTRCLQWS